MIAQIKFTYVSCLMWLSFNIAGHGLMWNDAPFGDRRMFVINSLIERDYEQESINCVGVC